MYLLFIIQYLELLNVLLFINIVIRNDVNVVNIFIFILFIIYLILISLLTNSDKIYHNIMSSSYISFIVIGLYILAGCYIRCVESEAENSSCAHFIVALFVVGIILSLSFVEIILMLLWTIIIYMGYLLDHNDFKIDTFVLDGIIQYTYISILYLITFYSYVRSKKNSFLLRKKLDQKIVMLNVELEGLPFMLRHAVNDGNVKDATLGCIIDPKDLLNTEKLNESGTASRAELRRTPVFIRV